MITPQGLSVPSSFNELYILQKASDSFIEVQQTRLNYNTVLLNDFSRASKLVVVNKTHFFVNWLPYLISLMLNDLPINHVEIHSTGHHGEDHNQSSHTKKNPFIRGLKKKREAKLTFSHLMQSGVASLVKALNSFLKQCKLSFLSFGTNCDTQFYGKFFVRTCPTRFQGI